MATVASKRSCLHAYFGFKKEGLDMSNGTQHLKSIEKYCGQVVTGSG